MRINVNRQIATIAHGTVKPKPVFLRGVNVTQEPVRILEVNACAKEHHQISVRVSARRGLIRANVPTGIVMVKVLDIGQVLENELHAGSQPRVVEDNDGFMLCARRKASVGRNETPSVINGLRNGIAGVNVNHGDFHFIPIVAPSHLRFQKM